MVLGFVAGLWLAPRLERLLPGVLAMLLAFPLVALAGAALWRALPRSFVGRLPNGSEIALHLLLLALGAAACVELSPWLEARFFRGDISSWLQDTTGLVYDQRNALVAGIAMGFAVIPIVLSLSDDALSNVPASLSAASLARAVSSGSACWLLLSLLAALLGVLAYSTGIYMLIVLVVFCLAKLLRPQLPGPNSRPALLGAMSVALLVLGLGVAFRNAPKAKPDFAFDILGLAQFALIYLGNAFTTGPIRLIAGALILAAGIASIWRLASERAEPGSLAAADLLKELEHG